MWLMLWEQGSGSSMGAAGPALRLHGLEPSRLTHLWELPNNSTGVYCHLLLQSLPNPGIKPGLLHCRWILLDLAWEVLKGSTYSYQNNPSISLLFTHRKWNPGFEQTWILMFIAALSTRDRGKTTKWTSDKWPKCSIYIKYYSAFIKSSDFLITATTWMNLKGIMLSKLDKKWQTQHDSIHEVWNKQIKKKQKLARWMGKIGNALFLTGDKAASLCNKNV